VQLALDHLQLYLEWLHSRVVFGSVPGSYFPLQWEETGSPISTGAKHRVVINWKMQPVFLSAFALGGAMTIDVELEGTSILSNGSWSITAGDNILSAPSDFSTDEIGQKSGTVVLDVDSVDTGTPTLLSVLLVCKSLDRLEQEA